MPGIRDLVHLVDPPQASRESRKWRTLSVCQRLSGGDDIWKWKILDYTPLNPSWDRSPWSHATSVPIGYRFVSVLCALPVTVDLAASNWVLLPVTVSLTASVCGSHCQWLEVCQPVTVGHLFISKCAFFTAFMSCQLLSILLYPLHRFILQNLYCL